jgi:hypothetical protein
MTFAERKIMPIEGLTERQRMMIDAAAEDVLLCCCCGFITPLKYSYWELNLQKSMRTDTEANNGSRSRSQIAAA